MRLAFVNFVQKNFFDKVFLVPRNAQETKNWSLDLPVEDFDFSLKKLNSNVISQIVMKLINMKKQ